VAYALGGYIVIRGECDTGSVREIFHLIQFFVDHEVRRLRTVEPAQVLCVACEMFVPDNLAIASLGPRQEDLLALL